MKTEENDNEDLKNGAMPTSIEGNPNDGKNESEDLEKGEDEDKGDDDDKDKPVIGGGSSGFPVEK